MVMKLKTKLGDCFGWRTLCEHYTQFRDAMESTLNEHSGSEVAKTIVIEPSNDGSQVGAALLAASHSQYLEVES